MDSWWPPGIARPESGHTESIEQYGCGAYDETTGLYEWYELPVHLAPGAKGTTITWPEILTHWGLIEADLHSEYGINITNQHNLKQYSWRYLRCRIIGLLTADTRIARLLAPEQKS